MSCWSAGTSCPNGAFSLILVHSQLTYGVGWKAGKSLTLCKYCSATAKTSRNYQHHFQYKYKTKPHICYYKEKLTLSWKKTTTNMRICLNLFLVAVHHLTVMNTLANNFIDYLLQTFSELKLTGLDSLFPPVWTPMQSRSPMLHYLLFFKWHFDYETASDVSDIFLVFLGKSHKKSVHTNLWRNWRIACACHLKNKLIFKKCMAFRCYGR